MNDHHVDQLLKDLDDALAVAPSVETIAKVRSRIAEQPASRWPWFSWRVAAAVAATVAIVVLGYLRWGPETTKPNEVASVAPPVQPPTAEARAPQPTSSEPARVARRAPSVSSAVRAASTTEDDRLRVIVSPDQRRGVEQLRAALRAGRITAESFAEPPPAADPPAFELKALEIPSVAIEPFKVETPGSTTGGGSVR